MPVFTIGFGGQPDVGFLQSLSQASQGDYSAANTTNVGDVYARIGRLLRGQYVLTLTAKQPADGKPAQLRIDAKAAGGQAEGTATFTRGSAPAVAPVATAAQPAPAATTTKSGSGGSSTLLIAIAVVVALALVGGGALLLLRRARAARAQREREREAGRQSDESVPVAAGTLLPSTRGAAAQGSGRLVERPAPGASGEARVFELGGGPAVIGSGRDATVRLEGEGVAPEHARIWLRDGRYLLHHTAGLRRRTLVGGAVADWVTLEPGDEVQIGAHRLVFEDAGTDPQPTARRDTQMGADVGGSRVDSFPRDSQASADSANGARAPSPAVVGCGTAAAGCAPPSQVTNHRFLQH